MTLPSWNREIGDASLASKHSALGREDILGAYPLRRFSLTGLCHILRVVQPSPKGTMYKTVGYAPIYPTAFVQIN